MTKSYMLPCICGIQRLGADVQPDIAGQAESASAAHQYGVQLYCLHRCFRLVITLHCSVYCIVCPAAL